MPDAWRIDRLGRRDSAFTGFGASVAGGRWNPAGIHVVYASEHLATAALERLVHLPKPVPAALRFLQFPILFHGVRIERPPRSALPANWRAEPVEGESQQFGEDWYRRGFTAVLAVPCAIIPEEWNYVINPGHPDFRKLEIGPPEAFCLDPRLANSSSR